MESRELDPVLASIKASVPPYDFGILGRVASIDWDGLIDDEIAAATEIILRLTAAAILCGDMTGEARKGHAEALGLIARRVRASSLPSRDDDFRRYFDKFQTRTMELR